MKEPSYYKNSLGYESYTFSTKSLPIFSEFSYFYFQGKKIVPSNIYELLTPISLAIWFMDDGNTSLKSGGLHISTESFT
jgi:hypothetical protein